MTAGCQLQVVSLKQGLASQAAAQQAAPCAREPSNRIDVHEFATYLWVLRCLFVLHFHVCNPAGCQLQVMSLEQALATQAAAQQAAAGRGGASSSRGGGGAAAAAAATITLAPTVMEASLNRMFEGTGNARFISWWLVGSRV